LPANKKGKRGGTRSSGSQGKEDEEKNGGLNKNCLGHFANFGRAGEGGDYRWKYSMEETEA